MVWSWVEHDMVMGKLWHSHGATIMWSWVNIESPRVNHQRSWVNIEKSMFTLQHIIRYAIQPNPFIKKEITVFFSIIKKCYPTTADKSRLNTNLKRIFALQRIEYPKQGFSSAVRYRYPIAIVHDDGATILFFVPFNAIEVHQVRLVCPKEPIPF